MMRALVKLRRARDAGTRTVVAFAADVGRGLLEISHNTLALVGLAALAVLALALGRADVRHQVEVTALEWLQTRHEERTLASGDLLALVAEPEAVARATATNVADLPREQASLTNWIARRYKVAPEAVGALVQEAYALSKRAGLDPTLILAIMAVESSFNPFAQSPVGAQGLMQVMTRVHDDKYSAFGGVHAAFDPISNLRVGVQVLKECIARAGSVQAGLRYYVGAALLEGDGGYAARVMLEQDHMRNVASGKKVPLNASNKPPKALEASLPVESLPSVPDAEDKATPAHEQVALLVR
jgi:soluble lytic murein transglycosylase-like protein